MELNNRIGEVMETVKKIKVKINEMKHIHTRIEAAASASEQPRGAAAAAEQPREARTRTEAQNTTPAAISEEAQWRKWMEQRLLAQEDSTRHLHNRLQSLEETVTQLSHAVSQLKKPSSPSLFQDDLFFAPESTSFIRRNFSNSAAAALSSPLKKTADDFFGKVRTCGSVANAELTLDNISREFTGKLKLEQVVRATLADQIVGITTSPYEDSVSKCQRKLEFLGTQEELIEEEEQAKKKQSAVSNKDVAFEEMLHATAADLQQQARAIALDKQEPLCKVVEALPVLASASEEEMKKRKRGRPFKVRDILAEAPEPEGPRKGRGRPKKFGPFKVKGPRGRPHKRTDDRPESTSFVKRNLSNSAALSSPLEKTADDLLGKVRTGGSVANAELTLDNISRDFTVFGKLKPEEVVRATLPDQVVDIVVITNPYEDSVSKCQRKLEFLGTQEELIKESSVTTMGLGSVDEILDATIEGETCHGLNKLLLEAQTPNEVLEVISDTMLAIDKGLSPSPLCPLNLETAIYRIARLMDEASMPKFQRSHFARRIKMRALVSMAMKALDELSAQSISNMAWAPPKIGGESRYGLEMVKVRSKIGNFDVG